MKTVMEVAVSSETQVVLRDVEGRALFHVMLHRIGDRVSNITIMLEPSCTADCAVPTIVYDAAVPKPALIRRKG